MTELWQRLMCLLRRRRLDADLEEELRHHLEMTAREYVACGMEPEEARLAALRRFGNVTSVREGCREFWGWRLLDELAGDIRIGIRMLAKRRGLTLTALLSLTLGIGGAITIYTILHSVLLRPLPYRDSDRIVAVWAEMTGAEHERLPALPDYAAWCEGNSFFEEMAALLPNQEMNLTGDGPPEWLQGQKATASLFPLLGIQPEIGRTFTEADEQKGAAPVAVLGYNFWQSRFNGDPGILGRTIGIDGLVHEVIGVMPRGFGIPDERVPLWTPFDLSPAVVRDSPYHVYAFARLRPGAGLDTARSMMTALAVQAQPETRENSQEPRGAVMPLQEMLVGPVRERLLPLWGGVAFLLMIAYANVAGLLLAAGVDRFSESALRAALGASSRRLVRQFLTESLLLSLAGCAAGLCLAWFLVEPLASLSPLELPRRAEIRLDPAIMLLAAGLSLLAGIIFGLFPALASSRPELTSWIQSSGSRATAGFTRQRARRLMVVAQIAVALTLCTGAGLMMQSLRRLLAVDVGFDTKQLITFQVRLPESLYATEIKDGTREAGWSRVSLSAPARYQEILEELRGIPGIESVTAISWLPMNPIYFEARLFSIVGRADPERGKPAPGGGYNPVDVNFFRTMRIPLIRGRMFDDGDRADAPWVVLINETLAKTWWPDQDPIGQYINYADFGDSRPRQVVGIVKDMRQIRLNLAPRGQVYFPFTQLPPENHTNRVRTRLHMSFILRTRLDVEQLSANLQEAVRRVDTQIPIFAVQPIQDLLIATARETRFLTLLLGVFAVVAVVLAAVGLYGVVDYSVAQRTREFGIRMAMGADPRDITGRVLHQAFGIGLAGIAAGIAFALGLTQFLASILFGITPTDPITFLVVCLATGAIALIAGYLPARRASRVDPVIALRSE